FIACPRGVGASSMRIFESMRAGRAPVIISDAWEPPPFIDWASCSLRIPESEVATLPIILREHADKAISMGLKARQEWEKVFSHEGLLHHTVEACLSILEARKNATIKHKLTAIRNSLSPTYFRFMLRYLKKSIGIK
ncbi:MAG: exostosin family protein, partial [Bacteroidota bacterium]